MQNRRSKNAPVLEVCVDSVASAIAAEKGGGDRLELCSNLIIGGTSPSPALYQEVRKHTSIPIRVLLRPRFGDFCYNDSEFEILKEEVRIFQKLRADGVVIGILKPNGVLDMERMKMLCELAGDMTITLHRAFDVCKDPMKTLEQAKHLGIDTILTSGQKNNCIDGKELLRDLVKCAEDDIEILIGSGVNAGVISELAPYTGAMAFHLSGKKECNSAMKYRKDDVAMGLPLMSEYIIWQTDEEMIRQAKQSLLEKRFDL